MVMKCKSYILLVCILIAIIVAGLLVRKFPKTNGFKHNNAIDGTYTIKPKLNN